jgi:hypothetical protein
MQLSALKRIFLLGALAPLMLMQGCTILAIADTVGSAAVGAAGMATDAAIGTVKLTGKAVGAAANAVIPD